MQDFNKEILETMKNQVSKIKSVYEVCDYCKEGNRIANEEYLKKYPTHKDLLSIFEQAISILELNMINEYNEHIVENIIYDIEFLIGQNVLTEAHIQRLLLGPITLQKFPIFKKKFENINERLNKLYVCESDRFYYKYDEFKASRPFNYQQLESYMRYNKVGYEEELINSDYNGDYLYENNMFDIDESLNDKIINKYPSLESINVVDRFKLVQHGLKPIVEFNNQFIHYKNGIQYNLFKTKNEYYMINECKSYKITIEDNFNDVLIESLYEGRK